MFTLKTSLLGVPGGGLLSGIAVLKHSTIVRASPRICFPIGICNQKQIKNEFHTSVSPQALRKGLFQKTIQPCRAERWSLLLSLRQGNRKFHSTPTQRFLPGRDPFNTNDRRYLFSFDRWSLIVTGVTILVASSVFLMILPYLLVTLFPFIIAAIVYFGFQKYKLNLITSQIQNALSRSSMKLSAATRRELILKELRPRVELFEEMLKMGRLDVDVSNFPSGFSNWVRKQMEINNYPHADRFLKFLNSRIDESMRKNEDNIRSITLGKNSVYRPKMVKLNEENQEVISAFETDDKAYDVKTFNLVLHDEAGVEKPVGVILVVVAVDKKDLIALGPLFASPGSYDMHKAFPMVIAVKNSDFIPKMGFITDIGETGRKG